MPRRPPGRRQSRPTRWRSDTVERLWSPWRLAYVSGTGSAAGCVFCDGSEAGGSGADLVLIRGRHAYVLLNLFPYNNGHLMVVPNRHLASLATATADELTELIQLTRDAELALTEAYQPQGINIGINLGRPAGAGIVDHLHVHLVPRWNGDTNFMSVVGNVRVLPEELGQTAARLRPVFERLAAARP
jgi:ATP adenylyltransferase